MGKIIEFIKRLLLRDEGFDSYVNSLCISWDKIPDPTQETRRVERIPCRAHRMTARNVLGKLLLKRRWKKGGLAGPAAFTHNGTVLEVYPFQPLM